MNKQWTGAYVCYVCKKCECAFIAEDYTNAQDKAPQWRYCRECCKELGIKYEEQTPKKNKTKEQNERYAKLAEMGKRNLLKNH